MKIISKIEIPNQTCRLCHTEVKIKHKDLKENYLILNKSDWICPICKTRQEVKFNMEKR